MGTIIDYVERRGSVPLSAQPLGEVDALVLSYLAYMPMGGIVGEAFDGGIPLSQVAQSLLSCGACARIVGERHARDRRLLAALKKSARFGTMRATGFVERYNEDIQEQFCAVTFLYGDEAFAAYRGTDGTLVGWKEDFNMSFAREVPAQRSAMRYAQEALMKLRRPMTLGGHSKGGNLAAYAALFAGEQVRKSVRLAYNFDGPGFNEAVAARRARSEAARIRTFVPQGSIVGMLLWHSEPFTLVQSDGTGLLQHDPLTWQVMGGRFVPADRRTLGSRFADATIKDWLLNLPEATRRKAIDGIYEIVSAGGDRTVEELLDAPHFFAMLRAAVGMDGETRRAIEEMLALLGVAAAEAAAEGVARIGRMDG